MKGVAAEKQRADNENTLLQSILQTAGPAAQQADKLGSELEKLQAACDPFKDFQDSTIDAKATADTIDLYAQAAQESATEAKECADKASRSGSTIQTIQQIQQFINNCDYQSALASAMQLQNEDPENQWLAQNLGKLEEMANTLASVESQV